MIINKNRCTQKDLAALDKLTVDFKNYEPFDFSNKIVKKPWGHEYLLFENEDVAIWILHIKADHKTSMHCHIEKNTSLISLSGTITCKTLNDSTKLNELEGIYFGKKVFHETLNISNDEVIVMEIETPVNKWDLVRINDEYGRVGKEYEQSKHYEAKNGLTLFSSTNNTQRKFNKSSVTIGTVKTKEEFLEVCRSVNSKAIVTLLNRNIWSQDGEKEFQVGELFVAHEDIFEKNKINNNFTYMIISNEGIK